MSCISTNTADDVRGEIALLGAVEFSVSNLTAVLASLVLVITESTVESSKFTQLVTLQLVLTFWDGCSLLMLVDHVRL